MHGMKSNLLLAMSTAITFSTVPGLNAAPAGIGPNFKGPLGLQLYSLRDQFKQDVPGSLDKVRAFGFQYVELAGTYGLKNEEFKAMLDARGLKPIASHYPFEQLRDDIEAVAQNAKAFGLQYAGCAWIPHGDPFNEKTCREAIAVFNKAGVALAKHGIKFFYHIHGYEFQPFGNGTLMDLLMKETKPELVAFEMDVFWAAHAGQDPVKLLKAHPGRWELTHLKGMKASTPTGLLTGHTDVSNDVPVGEGKIDYRPFLSAAEKAGVKWHFIEDESPLVLEQIPKTLRYLETVKW
jgi:sugar phosphate isomerase/epimerase